MILYYMTSFCPSLEVSTKRPLKHMKNIYLQAFVGMSMAGSAFHGYCFAFHLINIVNNNQLLSGVIQAVTQNGNYNVWK